MHYRNQFQDVVIVLLWYRDEFLVLVRDPDEPSGDYRLPGGKMLDVETLAQAAMRKTRDDIGILVDADRFSDVICTKPGAEQTMLRSVRANLTDVEYKLMPKRNQSGTREIFFVHRRDIKLFLRKKRDRLLLVPGTFS